MTKDQSGKSNEQSQSNESSELKDSELDSVAGGIVIVGGVVQRPGTKLNPAGTTGQLGINWGDGCLEQPDKR